MRLKVDLLPREKYSDVVVLIDVLRGTTTAPILFDSGCSSLYLTPSLKTARALAAEHNLLLAGERDGALIEGFQLVASPKELRHKDIKQGVVYMAQSPPKVLHQLKTAKHVFLGSFYNARAVVAKVTQHASEEIALVCAGHAGEEALEDSVCAGFLARRLQREYPNIEYKDAARMAMALVRAFPEVQEALVQSATGEELFKHGLWEDIAIASLISQSEKVPHLTRVFDYEGQEVYEFQA